jgi:regulator of protease activity HflC (stomatin/prohibitin superfamily)
MNVLLIILAILFGLYLLLKAAQVLVVPVAVHRGIIIGSVAALAIIGLMASYVQVEDGTVQVVKKFGKYDGYLEAGPNFILPIYSTEEVDIKTRQYRTCTSCTGVQSVIEAQTADEVTVSVNVTLNYRVGPTYASDLLRTVGQEVESKIILAHGRTKVRTAIRNSLYTELYKKAKIEATVVEIRNYLEEKFAEQGIILELFEIREIIPPENLRTAIEDKMVAEQDAQKMDFVLEKERKEKERKIIAAEAIAESNRIINQSITAKNIEWERIQVEKEYAGNGAKHIIVSSPNQDVILGMNR